MSDNLATYKVSEIFLKKVNGQLDVDELPIEKYSSIIDESKVEQIKTLATTTEGKRICHVNSTAYGGGYHKNRTRVLACIAIPLKLRLQ